MTQDSAGVHGHATRYIEVRPSRVPPRWEVVAAILPVVFPLLVGAIGLELWLALSRLVDVSPADRLATWLAIVVPLALWLRLVWVLARAGASENPLAVPLGVLLPPIVGLALLSRLPLLPQLLDATPRSWLIGLMVIRVVGGVFLVARASGEVAKPWFNLRRAAWTSSSGPARCPSPGGWLPGRRSRSGSGSDGTCSACSTSPSPSGSRGSAAGRARCWR